MLFCNSLADLQPPGYANHFKEPQSVYIFFMNVLGKYSDERTNIRAQCITNRGKLGTGGR